MAFILIADISTVGHPYTHDLVLLSDILLAAAAAAAVVVVVLLLLKRYLRNGDCTLMHQADIICPRPQALNGKP